MCPSRVRYPADLSAECMVVAHLVSAGLLQALTGWMSVGVRGARSCAMELVPGMFRALQLHSQKETQSGHDRTDDCCFARLLNGVRILHG